MKKLAHSYTSKWNLGTKIDHFLFCDSQKKESHYFLVFFRMAIGLLAITDILSIAEDFSFFFSKKDAVIPQGLAYLTSEYFTALDIFYWGLNTIGVLDLFYDHVVMVYFFFLVLLICGVMTRFSAIACLLLQLIIFRSFPIFNYGYDHFLTMSLFYCVLFPVGRFFSVDNLIFQRKKNTMTLPYRRILQIHVALVYFFSGIAKSVDPNWWDGDAIWRSTASFFNSSFYIPPWILAIMGVSVVLMELLHPLFVSINRTRKLIVLGVIMMHLSIGLVMGLYSFAAIMIIWNITAFNDFRIPEKRIVYETETST